ncbi:MAG: hypothetical protein OHK0015_22270 [Chloroflexi bacterium OHK40]
MLRLTYRDYLELPAPLSAATAVLRDPAAWAGAIGAERLGTFWRYGGELYTLVDQHRAGDAHMAVIGWRVAPATGHGPCLTLELTLRDAVISSHAELRLVVEAPGRAGLWRVAALRRRVSRALRAVVARLGALLRAAELEAPATAPARVRASVVVEAGRGEEVETPLPQELHTATPAQAALAERLRLRYPLTVAHFAAMGALDHLERVARLERGWERIMRGEYDRDVYELVPVLPEAPAYDLIYAGGGLGLLHAAVMAARLGWRVLIFDRSEVGCAHREWNISREELAALVASGVVSWAELEPVIMREYRNGLVRFYNRPGSDVRAVDLWMPEVLNVALDAGALLRLMRRKLEEAGGTVLSGRAFRRLRVAAAGPLRVEVELQDLTTGALECYTGRLLLDGMGSTSPLALYRHAGRPFAGVCPTVGTVASGFARGNGPGEYDPTLGDILMSVADAQRGEQLMWEGFPGRGDELTVYLFYYSTVETAGGGSPVGGLRAGSPRYSLLDLFEQYFTLLPTYKRPGPGFHHVKPVYGYIPARHSLRRQEAPLPRGVLPVGDSAAQQSPLTFCGFGSHVRNLRRTTGLLDHALRHELLEPDQLALINPFQVNVSLNWVFSRFMHPWDAPDNVNRLQNLFYAVLNDDLGVDRATRYFRDRMRWGDYHPMLFGVLRRWPQILLAAWGVLGPRGIAQWAGDYLRFSWSAALAAIARLGGPMAERLLVDLADARSAALGLRVRASYAEWRAMGWLS